MESTASLLRVVPAIQDAKPPSKWSERNVPIASASPNSVNRLQNMNELNQADRHLLRLVRQGKDAEGWSKVSAVVLPLVQKLPPELVTLELTEPGGRAKLTDAGETVLYWT